MEETLLYYSDTPFKGPGYADYITSAHGHICKANDNHDVPVIGPVHQGKPGPRWIHPQGIVAIDSKLIPRW